MAQGLTIISAACGAGQAHAADAACRRVAEQGGRVVRLLPSPDAAARTRRRLADMGDPGLGCAVSTLAHWVADRWAVFGDGRALVDAPLRRAFVLEALGRGGGSGGSFATRGMLPCLEGIVASGAGVPAFEDADPGDARLSGAERTLVALCRAYRDLLEERGLVEPGLAAALLPAAMGGAGWSHLVLEGTAGLSDVACTLVAAAAARAGATCICRLGDNPAFAAANAAAARLASACRAAGVPVTRADARDLDPAADLLPWRSRELADLAARLFRGGAGKAVEPRGDVRFCLPAGRYAEADLVARCLQDLVSRNIAPRDIIVACTDPLAWAQRLAGRLGEGYPRGIGCHAAGSVPWRTTEAGRILCDLTALACAPDPTAPRPDLRATASDVARNPLAGIGQAAAVRLDRSWRARRAASPADFLRDLASAVQEAWAEGGGPDGVRDAGAGPRPGAPLAEGIDALLSGDTAAAVSAIERGIAGVGARQTLQRAACAAARRLLAAQAAVGAQPASPDGLERLAGDLFLPVRYLWPAPGDVAAQDEAAVLDGNPNAVRFMRLGDVEGQECRALVICDLTADAYPAADRLDARAALWAKLGIEPGPDALSVLRWRVRCALEAASDELVLERPLADEDARTLRPATVLEELVDCYCADPSDIEGLDRATALPKGVGLPAATCGEERFAELASPVTYAPARFELAAPALVPSRAAVREALARADGVFSPSAIELYLRCPLRWLYERRLPGDGPDAGFGPLEFGSFNHDVLCRFHRALPSLGIERIEESVPAALWEGAFDACFDAALADQRDAQNPLVPADELEREQVEANRRRLRSCIARDALLPRGFVPHLHEWGFGFEGSAVPPVPYGGVLLRGSIDRVDATADGRALVIDYKGSLGIGHGPAGAPGDGAGAAADPAYALTHLPLHSQALMYATALARVRTDLAPVGALYVSYADGAAAGFADASVGDPTAFAKGGYLGERCLLPPAPDGSGGFAALLATVERAVADAMARLLDGDTDPDPRFGGQSCANCSLAHTCPRRMS